MQNPGSKNPLDAAALRPVTFMVGTHALSVVMLQEGRWSVGVDGAPPSGMYRNQVEAWEEGVRRADALTPR
jgi:hypothetical protein